MLRFRVRLHAATPFIAGALAFALYATASESHAEKPAFDPGAARAETSANDRDLAIPADLVIETGQGVIATMPRARAGR